MVFHRRKDFFRKKSNIIHKKHGYKKNFGLCTVYACTQAHLYSWINVRSTHHRHGIENLNSYFCTYSYPHPFYDIISYFLLPIVTSVLCLILWRQHCIFMRWCMPWDMLFNIFCQKKKITKDNGLHFGISYIYYLNERTLLFCMHSCIFI